MQRIGEPTELALRVLVEKVSNPERCHIATPIAANAVHSYTLTAHACSHAKKCEAEHSCSHAAYKYA
jgi:hypothetical protein